MAISIYAKLQVEANADLVRAATFYVSNEEYYFQLLQLGANASQAEVDFVKADLLFFQSEMEKFDSLEREYAFLLVFLHGAQAFTVLMANFLPFKRMSDSCQRIIAASLALITSPFSRLHRDTLTSELAEVHCCFAAEFTECPDESQGYSL